MGREVVLPECPYCGNKDPALFHVWIPLVHYHRFIGNELDPAYDYEGDSDNMSTYLICEKCNEGTVAPPGLVWWRNVADAGPHQGASSADDTAGS